MQGMDFSPCPTASAPEPRAARPALAGLFGLHTRWTARPVAATERAAAPAITLTRGQALRIQARAGQVLTLRSGRVWATLTGWPEDRWLDAGQRWVIPADGRLVIEASGAAGAQLQLAPPETSGQR